MTRRSKAGHRRTLGRPFAHLWSGFTLASAGDGFAYGAVPLLAVVINPHPLAVSAVVAADNLPWLLVALPAGHFADKYERRFVVILANVVRAAAILAAALLIAADHMTLALLLLIVLLNGSARAIYYSSLQAMVPGLVPTADLEHANGALTGTEAATEHLAGPIVGTTLFAASQPVPFFAEAIALLGSCFPFLRFRAPSSKRPAQEHSSMWEGVRLLFADTRLRVLVSFVALVALLQGMEAGILVLLATKQWGIKEGAYGLFLATVAVGNLIGSALADGQVARFGSARTIIGATAVSGAGYLVMAASHGWLLAGFAYTVVGIAIAIIAVVGISLRQRLTPPHLMGRVGGAWRGIIWGAAPVGAIVAGGVAAVGGLALPLAIAGVLQIVLAIVFARPFVRAIKDEHVRRARKERRRHAAGARASGSRAVADTAVAPGPDWAQPAPAHTAAPKALPQRESASEAENAITLDAP